MEVEVIGLPVDCSKEQTRVVDDNGEPPLPTTAKVGEVIRQLPVPKAAIGPV